MFRLNNTAWELPNIWVGQFHPTNPWRRKHPHTPHFNQPTLGEVPGADARLSRHKALAGHSDDGVTEQLDVLVGSHLLMRGGGRQLLGGESWRKRGGVGVGGNYETTAEAANL